jgi:hypothetical protein
MWGAAGLDGLLEGVLPNDPPFAQVPVIAALIMFCLLVTLGPRLPRRCLAMLGPLGVAAISYALSQSPGAGDGAILYTMPVLWTTFFYGRRGAVAIVACVAVGHAAALMLLPPSSVYPGRWLDVMVSVAASAIVVLALEGRNQALVARLASQANTDPLTGLLNRRGLDERATRDIAHARRDGSPVAVAAFDLDHFKDINDESGHETGDRVLVRLGRHRRAGGRRGVRRRPPRHRPRRRPRLHRPRSRQPGHRAQRSSARRPGERWDRLQQRRSRSRDTAAAGRLGPVRRQARRS